MREILALDKNPTDQRFKLAHYPYFGSVHIPKGMPQICAMVCAA